MSDQMAANPTPDAAESRKVVLLVEDNEDNQIVYTTALEHWGFHVLQAWNGRDGIEVALRERPDLILMDLSMPVLDGWSALNLIRQHDELRTTPVIALTAHALDDERVRGMDMGFDSYLAKPVEPRAVYTEVVRFIGEPQAS